MSTEEEIWRWNVDDTWQTFSSMFQEAFYTKNASNDIEKYHHLSASILFGACAVESFLNRQFREKFKNEIDEEKIFKKLRYTSLKEKLEKWPTKISNMIIDEKTQNIITTFLNLRHEVTHRKRRDHSLYRDLDETTPEQFISSVQSAFLVIYEGKKESFPYWLLGWNYVGMNHDETYPTLINNQQFKYSLNHMGFNIPSADYGAAQAWEKKYMTSRQMFNSFKEQIYNKAPDIEPRNHIFPTAPRLCKKWWDKALIKAE